MVHAVTGISPSATGRHVQVLFSSRSFIPFCLSLHGCFSHQNNSHEQDYAQAFGAHKNRIFIIT